MPLSREIIAQTLATSRGEAAYRIVEKLTDAGHDAWWVGGCARDMLLENVPKDIDIGTSATPDEVVRLFPKNDDSAAAFGTVRVTEKGTTFEITTFREDDSASDGRHPESVVFGHREQDAKRRDITINALYWHPISGEIYDPFCGEEDLKERLIRFVEHPATRIRHDALRLMRVVRFRALIDGQYHPDTYRALQEHAAMIETLSGTRRFEELEKMLLCPHPDRALEDLWETGILQHVLPELYACKGVAQPSDYHHEGDVWEHMMQLLRSFKDEHGADVRLAGLFHDCGKATTFSLSGSTPRPGSHSTSSGQAGQASSPQETRIRFDEHAPVSGELTRGALQRLQCPAKRRDKIVWLVKHHMMMNVCEMPEERKAHWYYHPWFPELLRVFWLDIAGTEPANFALYERILDDYHRFLDSHPRPPKPLLNGEEVMAILGIEPGEKVGEILKLLYEKQIRKEISTRDDARTFVELFIGQSER